MKIISVQSLAIPDVKVIKVGRFIDNRGYFTEPFRKSDLRAHAKLSEFKNIEFVQSNESYSKKGVCRGLHFQWNPFMGKLVRTLSGHMIDLFLDIRKGSPTCGMISAYDMPSISEDDFNEWIWIPPGFAHGNFFCKESIIEYFCSGEYNMNCEAGISPLADDLNWSLCPEDLRKLFDENVIKFGVLSEKDKKGLSLKMWLENPRSNNFVYGSC